MLEAGLLLQKKEREPPVYLVFTQRAKTGPVLSLGLFFECVKPACVCARA